MKAIFVFFVCLGLFVPRVWSQTYTVADLRGLASPQTGVVYQTTDYGGGFWNYFSATGATDNTGTVLVSTTTGGQYKRIFTGALNVRWFGATGDGVTNDVPAWTLAKAALPPEGGRIYFPKGRYMSDAANGWQVYRSNVHLYGDGINATYLLTPENTNAAGLSLAPYRDAGWSLNPTTLYTYVDSAAVGQSWIKLKPGQDKTPFKKNAVIFFSGGANYYDQFYGEFQVVDTVIADKIYFQYNLSKDYTVARSSWNGTLAADFTPPAVGASAVAQITSPPTAGGNVAVSVGNDLYRVSAVSGTNVTLINLGKGNGTAVIPAGTNVFKARAIYLTPSMVYNTIVEDMTIEGHRKSLVVSNSVKSYFNRVRLIYHNGASTGGIWIDGDDGRDFFMNNSEVHSDGFKSSQMARSFGDIRFVNSKFFQSNLEFSEFNFNFTVENCDIHIHKSNPAEAVTGAINVGNSTSMGRITNNRIYVSDAASAITVNDILGFKASSRAGISITDNQLYLNNCVSAFNIIGPGTVLVGQNTIIGSVSSIFGTSDGTLYGTTSQTDQFGRFVFGTNLVFKGNTFVGYANSLSSRSDPVNLVMEDNYISLFGPGPSPDGGALLLGNIIRGSSASVTPTLTVPAERLVLRNNIFRGWNYTRFSINLQRPVNNRVDISNNRFIDQTGTYRADKDFQITMPDANSIVYGSVNYLPMQKSPDIDWTIYASFVQRNGGTLSALDETVGKQMLRDIYFNNLRDKIDMINPMLGDAGASRVPLLGWERTIYKAFGSTTLSDADFTKTTGWTGNAAGKFGVAAVMKEFDFKNIGLFVQLSAGGASTNGAYIGTYAGGSQNSCLIRKTGGTLSGIGLATIANTYTPGPGFILSAQTTGSQLNFLDMTTQPKTSNTTLGAQLVNIPENNIALLAQTSTVGSAGYFSDATIACYGITKFTSLTEAQTLDQLVYNAMVSLGRNVQTNPGFVLSTEDLREGKTLITNPTSTELTGAILNSTYPMALKGQRINCPSVTGGALVYQKTDDNGQWVSSTYNLVP